MTFRTFLINLDRDEARLAHMAAACEREGMAFERVPAVLGIAMPDWVKPYFLDAKGAIASTLKPGEVGCYASHLVVARQLLSAQHLCALVLEDDLALPEGLAHLVGSVVAALPPGWDIARLSNPPKASCRTIVALDGDRDLVIYSRVPNNTGALLLSRSGAEKLLAPGLRSLPIDEHLRRPWLLGMETYGVVPAPIRSNIFDSTIDAMAHRGLGSENALAKFRRRHLGGPAEWLAQLRWQIAHLGFAGYASAITGSLARSARKRLSPGSGR